MNIRFTLNGEPVTVDVPGEMRLLRLLREHFGLTGAKPGCDIGVCGACAVLVDSKLVKSCLREVARVEGCEVITIEGLRAPDGGLTDLQQAFLDHGATQCGYCTPGMVIAGEALLRRTLSPTRQEIREAIQGNLCRCTGYQQIIDAVEQTARRRRTGR